MHLSIRLALALTLALVLIPLGACSEGIKVADWQIIDPKPPIDVTTIKVTRAQDACEGRPAVKQTLSIDAGTGHGSLTDTDGRVYPLQVEKDRLAQIVEFVSHRTWMDEKWNPPKKETAPAHYELTVVESGKPMKEKANWCVPSRKTLPEGFALLTETFDKADRVAHPLSKSVDLLK